MNDEEDEQKNMAGLATFPVIFILAAVTLLSILARVFGSGSHGGVEH